MAFPPCLLSFFCLQPEVSLDQRVRPFRLILPVMTSDFWPCFSSINGPFLKLHSLGALPPLPACVCPLG